MDWRLMYEEFESNLGTLGNLDLYQTWLQDAWPNLASHSVWS